MRNPGTINTGSGGTVGSGLTVTGHDYTMSFATSNRTVTPTSMHVYAATPAAGGLSLPAPTGMSGGDTFGAWRASGGPLAGAIVADTTDLSNGGTSLATSPGGPIAVALDAYFSQVITFSSTLPEQVTPEARTRCRRPVAGRATR